MAGEACWEGTAADRDVYMLSLTELSGTKDP